MKSKMKNRIRSIWSAIRWTIKAGDMIPPPVYRQKCHHLKLNKLTKVYWIHFAPHNSFKRIFVKIVNYWIIFPEQLKCFMKLKFSQNPIDFEVNKLKNKSVCHSIKKVFKTELKSFRLSAAGKYKTEQTF